MTANNKIKVVLLGLMATLSLLTVYAFVVSAISGPQFAAEQFSSYWYFLVSLAFGFGIQVSLYTYLKELVQGVVAGKTVAVTGTTSTLAMISCCAHYLANIIPILGIAGALTVIAQYQIQFFWVGIAFNLMGMGFIINKIIKFKHQS